jgi:hypothetical protein
MKRQIIVLAAAVLLFGCLLINCDNGTMDDLETSKGEEPVLNAILTSSSMTNLQNGLEQTTFRVNAQCWLGVGVYDPDKDVVSMNITMQKVGGVPESKDSPCSSMPDANAVLYTVFIPQPGDQGTWGISVYVTDAKGNKSNALIYAITVTY